MAIGVTCLAIILGLRYRWPRVPGILIAVVGSTIVSAPSVSRPAPGSSVVGPLPVGLPPLSLPPLVLSDIVAVAPAAFGIALVAATDTSILSRAFAGRRGEEVDQDRELLALGGANLATGLFTGMPVSSSSSRTPVAEASGAQTQLTSIVAAIAIGVGLVAAPGILADLPTATLAAVVIAAGLSLVDVGSIVRLWRAGSSEFWLALASFLGVALIGVIEGVFLAVALSLLAFIRRSWWPHDAVLGRADGVKGYHDLTYYPEARQIPGLLLYRFDAPLFFANADVFRDRVRERIQAATIAGPLGDRRRGADHRRRHHGRRDARSARGRAGASGDHPGLRRAEGPGARTTAPIRGPGAGPRGPHLPDRRDGRRRLRPGVRRVLDRLGGGWRPGPPLPRRPDEPPASEPPEPPR